MDADTEQPFSKETRLEESFAANLTDIRPKLVPPSNMTWADAGCMRNTQTISHGKGGNWLVRNVYWLKSFIRIVVGVVWLIDGYLKFQPGFVESFPGLIKSSGQPSWLQPWFNFWYNATVGNPAPFVYGTGVLEICLGAALVLGILRKLAYIGGILLSLLIWAVPEGFGGPYGPGSTDIGTGVVYSFVFVSLIMINAMSGPSKYSLDFFIERRFPSWRRIAEFN